MVVVRMPAVIKAAGRRQRPPNGHLLLTAIGTGSFHAHCHVFWMVVDLLWLLAGSNEGRSKGNLHGLFSSSVAN